MTSDSTVWAPRKTLNTSGLNVSQCDVDVQIIFCVDGLGNGEQFSENERRIQLDVFNKLTTAGVEPLWIPADECMRVSAHDPNFYVFPTFRGAAFEHLCEAKVKIIGASLVCQCLTEGKSIPKWSHPVFSLNLSGANVCFTGLSSEMRNHLSNLVRWMDGVVSYAFTTNVTHLITDKCVSSAPKYKVSKHHKLPVMSPRWLEDGWERALKLDIVKLTSNEIINAFKLPLFSNLVICTSGISGQDRSDMGRLIELHGGKNPGDMKRNECTHLIMEGTSGPKYRKAREWNNIHIVEPRWLRKCIEEGYVLSEKQFDPATPHLRSSTQAPHGQAPPAELDFSSILGSAKVPLTSQSFNATMDKDKVDKTSTPATATRPKFIRKESSRQVNATILTDPIDNLSEMSYRGDFDFLEGCLIWLCGVQESRVEKWKRVLDRCGATRVVKSDNATHIVVLNGAEEKKSLFDARKRGAVIVKPDWIIECVQKKDLMPVDDYIWTGESNTRNTNVSVVATTLITTNTSVANNTLETPREAEPIFSAGPSGNAINLNLKSQISSNVSSLSSERDNFICNKIFEGLKFRFRGLSAESVRNWSVECRKASGIVLPDSSNAIADYLITAQVEYGVLISPVDGKYCSIVTECWLRTCIAKSQLIDKTAHPLFRPIPAVQGSTIFETAVLGFLGLEPYEKIPYTELILTFGGRVECSIVTKPKNGVEPCTHLVPAAANAKITECCRKLPRLKIVDPSWIIESIINDKMLPTEQFPLQNVAYASYEGRTDDLWVERLPTTDELDEPPSSSMTIEEVDNFILGEISNTVENTFEQPTPARFEEPPRSTPRRVPERLGSGLKLELDGMTQVLDGISTPPATDNESTFNSFSVSGIGKVLAEAAVKTAQPVQKSYSENLSRSPISKPSVEYSYSENATSSHGYATRSRRSLSSPKISMEEALPFLQNNEISAASRRLVEQNLAEMRKEQAMEEEAAQAKQEIRTPHGKRRRRCFEISDSPQPKRTSRKNEHDFIDWEPRPAMPLIVNGSPQNKGGTFKVSAPSHHPTISAGSSNSEKDPRVEKDAVLNTLSTVSTRASSFQTSIPISARQPSDSRILSDNNHRVKSFEKEKIFLFTSISTLEEKNKLSRMITQLGGFAHSHDKTDITDDMTHLICGKLVRGTKLMGFIASGKWVLTVDYIEKSSEAGRWLPEEDFEWSHTNMLSKYGIQGRELQIALASRRWRLKLDKIRNERKREEPVGAFSGWKFVLYASREKAAGLTPLMEAGKAVVATREQVDSLRSFNPTHAICCNSSNWNEKELRDLVDLNAKVYTLDYISKYLLEDNVDESSCFHTDYKIILSSMKR